MRMRKLSMWSLPLCCWLLYSSSLCAADKSPKKAAKPDAVAEIDLFDGMHSKQLEVKVVALGSHRANVIIDNKTQSPVMVRLPQVFAAVPILGQFGGGQFGGGQFGGGQGSEAANLEVASLVEVKAGGKVAVAKAWEAALVPVKEEANSEAVNWVVVNWVVVS